MQRLKHLIVTTALLFNKVYTLIAITSTVVIDNHNYAQYLEEAIDSVLQQTRLPNEIIVIDDGSTDHSVALLKEKYASHPLIRLIFQENQGQLAALEHAALSAKSEIIFFLDSDDRYEPDYLATALDLYETYPQLDATICSCTSAFLSNKAEEKTHIYTAHFVKKEGFLVPLEGITAKYHFWGGLIASTHSMRRRIVNQIYPLPKTLKKIARTFGDQPLVLGSHLFARSLYVITTPYIYYRRHSQSDSLLNAKNPHARFKEYRLMTGLADFLSKKTKAQSIPTELVVRQYLSNPPIRMAYLFTKQHIETDLTLCGQEKRAYLEQINKQIPAKISIESARTNSPTWLSGSSKSH